MKSATMPWRIVFYLDNAFFTLDYLPFSIMMSNYFIAIIS